MSSITNNDEKEIEQKVVKSWRNKENKLNDEKVITKVKHVYFIILIKP
jgi:hypothetical protein